MKSDYWKSFRLYYLYKFKGMEKEAEECKNKFFEVGKELTHFAVIRS